LVIRTRQPKGKKQLNKEELSDIVRPIIQTFHEQYKQNLELQHENALEKDIRQVYCQLSVLRRLQAVTLSQNNGSRISIRTTFLLKTSRSWTIITFARM
jgi:hypothetical protein